MTVFGAETSPCPWPWPKSASDPEGLSVLGLLPYSVSLFDQPSFALSFPTVFLTKNVNQNAFSSFRYLEKVCLASTATFICKLLYFSSFFLWGTYSDSIEEEQGMLYFQLRSADFEKLSLNIL